MSKISDISFIENGANSEARFADMVDKYLGGQDSVSKSLDDGTQISIMKMSIGDRGVSRTIIIHDDTIGWKFVLYPIGNAYKDAKTSGLKCSSITFDLGELEGPMDSRDLDKLETFLAENM